MNEHQPSRQLVRLSLLLQLERRARAASPDELAFLIVNETFGLIPYRQAVLWRRSPRPSIVAISAITQVDRNAPLVVWYGQLFAQIAASSDAAMRTLTVVDVPSTFTGPWREWLAPHLIWVPLGHGDDVLVLGRDAPPDEAEAQLMAYLADAYGHALAAMRPRGLRASSVSLLAGRSRRITIAAAILLTAAGLLPVRQSALAPAEIVPRNPAVIRAPLDGVVDRILVKPNEAVAEGSVLFNLDDRRLRSQLDAAGGALQAIELELRQARQLAVVDQKVRASLPVLQGKHDQQVAEVAYLREQLGRIEVRAPRKGVVLLDDPNDWLGRPVTIGERVMMVADPDNVEVQARLSVADIITLQADAPVRLFLNIAPEQPLEAVLTQASYQPSQSPDGILSYRLKARLSQEGSSPPRIGLKGTAKLYGQTVPLAYALFRRPFASLRQWIGL